MSNLCLLSVHEKAGNRDKQSKPGNTGTGSNCRVWQSALPSSAIKAPQGRPETNRQMGDAQHLRRRWIVFKGLPLFLRLKHSTSLRAAEHCGTANRSRYHPSWRKGSRWLKSQASWQSEPGNGCKILQASRKSLPESKKRCYSSLRN